MINVFAVVEVKGGKFSNIIINRNTRNNIKTIHTTKEKSKMK
jgi:hypothetical protein